MDLETLFAQYGTDKGTALHHYHTAYEEVCAGREIRAVLEIGVLTGASLQAWAARWPEAEVYGIDINPSAKAPEHPRIHVLHADATKPEAVWLLPPQLGFDLIVDDASHEIKDQLATFTLFLPVLAATGVYVIEDIREMATLGNQ
jgi:trans-aconitate methyltransferase